jgi:HEAT repeat protein
MLDINLQIKMIDALGIMHAAIRNFILYPPASPAIANTIEKLHLSFIDILEQKAPLIIAESERRFLIWGEYLDQKDREKTHIKALLNILLNFGIKSVSFDKGLEKEELRIFIKYLSKNPEELKDEGGLPKIMAEKSILHIYLDERVYVSMDKDQKIISDFNINDQKPSKQDTLKTDKATKDQLPEGIADMENNASSLITDLLGENAEVRSNASDKLYAIIESLPPERQNELLESLSDRLVEWIKLETSVSTSYEKICISLLRLMNIFIRQGRFAEVMPILDVFDNINTGVLKKIDPVREISSIIIRNLASEDNRLILFKEYHTNERNKQNEANQILLRFGSAILNNLLDMVRDVSDSHERVRVMHLIIGMGQRAIPVIKDRIHKNAPWYYLRNLAYLLGRIGHENDAYMLQPLLIHENNKVQMEAMKSIFQIGGAQRGTLFLSALAQADDQFKLNIIEMLGKVKYTKAVTPLLDMLKKPPKLTLIDQTALQEKICAALEYIGSPEAIPTLSEIAESKSFLGIRWYYTVELRNAAKRALESIKRKQKSSGSVEG